MSSRLPGLEDVHPSGRDVRARNHRRDRHLSRRRFGHVLSDRPVKRVSRVAASCEREGTGTFPC